VKQRLFTLIIFFLINYSVLAQINIDSLWREWNNPAQHDTNRLNAMKLISWNGYLFKKPDSAYCFARMQYDFAVQKKLKFYQAEALNTMGASHFFRSNYDSAVFYYNKCLSIREQIDDRKGIAAIYNNLGAIYKEQGFFEKAIVYYHRSLKIEEELGNRQGVAMSLNNLGIVYHSTANYPKAIEYHTRSLGIKESLGDEKGVGVSLNNIGLIYQVQQEYEKALEYFEKSMEIKLKLEDYKGVAYAYSNLGTVYFNKNQFSKAEEFYQKSLAMRNEIGDKIGLITTHNNLGALYQEQNKYKEAMSSHNEALKIAEEIGNKEGIAYSMLNIGSLYKSLGEVDKSIEFAKKSYDLARELGSVLHLRNATLLLFENLSKKGSYKEALDMYMQHIVMRDSINKEDNKGAVLKKEMEYLFQKERDEAEKQKVLSEMQYEKQLAISKAEKQRQRFVTIIITLGLVLLLVFSVLVYNRLRVTNKQKKTIEFQKNLVEEKQKEILDSIHYAKHIQEALLKDGKIISAFLPPHFIIFNPKDIVSGDFYWTIQRDNQIYIAVADCTGHGVPGAFLTMLGTAFLNEITAKSQNLSPANILDELRNKFVKELNQTESLFASKDGMDVSLVALQQVDGVSAESDYNLHNQTHTLLNWAGANNPLWIITNENRTELSSFQYLNGVNDKTLYEIKADKQPIGYDDGMTPFKNHEFQLKQGDLIYLFSDGFQDQFGGDNNKKFKASRFKELLLANCEKPMEEQKKLIVQTFEDWRGDFEQVDDICIIGLRL
jgi:tetratricopeptide (TPR) repeat protein